MGDGQSISCSACGKQYSWNAALAGKKVRCACGQVFAMPAEPPRGAGGGEDDLMDLAPEPAAAPAKPKVDRTALNDAIRTRMGVMPGKTGETRERERLEADRAADEERTKPNALRDTWIPVILIVVGVCLSFYEVMHTGPKPLRFGPAIPVVMGKLLLAIGLVSGGIVLARALLEVSLVHDLGPSMLRILAIAIGPSALYGLFATNSSDLAGPFFGIVASIAAYSVLYWRLLQLSGRDTAICVLMTWIMVAGANYAAYRAQGIMMGAEI